MKGFVILGTVVDAILQATGAERVTFGNKLGKFTTTPRPWAKPSASKFHRINGLVIGKDFPVRIVDVSIRERWNVEDEHVLLQRIEWGVQRGILKPLDSRMAYLLLQHGEADAVVTLEELNAWGKAVGNYEFERAQAEGVCAEGDQEVGASEINSKRTAPPAFVKAFSELLDTIEEKATKKGLQFNRLKMPGTYQDLHECAKSRPEFPSNTMGTFRQYCKTSGVKYAFKSHAEQTDFYKALFGIVTT